MKLTVMLSLALLPCLLHSIEVTRQEPKQHRGRHSLPFWRQSSPRVLQLVKPRKLALTAKHARLRQGHHLNADLGTWQEVELLHSLQYFGNVSVGTPLQNFSVAFDSGSGALLLPSDRCSSPACHGLHTLYRANLSSTSIPIGWADSPLEKADDESNRDIATETYAMGEATGVYMRDVACLRPGLCATVDLIETLEESDSPFKMAKWDGILGLSLPAVSPAMEFNTLAQLFTQESLVAPVFAVGLGRLIEDKSVITFGGWRASHVQDSISWVSVSDPGYWQFTLTDIVFDNISAGVCNGTCQAVVDTGSSLLMGPEKMGQALEALLRVHMHDCNDTSALPRLGFQIGTQTLYLEPDDYMDIDRNTCLFAWTSVKDTGKGPLLVLGMPFLRRYYTIFDANASSPRLGFARSSDTANASTKYAALADAAEDMHNHTGSSSRRKVIDIELSAFRG